MRTLEDIFYGSLDARTNHRNYETRLERYRALTEKGEHTMLEMLTDAQRAQHEKFRAASDKLHELEACIAFEDGFCLGVKLMAEVMQTNVVPDIDDL